MTANLSLQEAAHAHAEPSQSQHLPPARSWVVTEVTGLVTEWTQCLASTHLPPASAKSLP